MWKKLAIACASAVVTLLLVEGAVRAGLALRGRPHDPAALATELRRRVDPMGAFVPQARERPGQQGGLPEIRRPLLHPFTGSESAHDTGGVLAAFHRGFAPDEYTIVVVGGSVAASWALSEGPAAQRSLEADARFAGQRVRVLNYAHASFKQPQQLMRLAYLFSLGYRPDAVLSIDGFNEVALSLQNLSEGVHPVYPPPPVWSALVRDFDVVDVERLERAGRMWALRRESDRRASRALRWKLHHSCILGPLALAGLKRIQDERAALQRDDASARAERRAGAPGPRPVDRQARGPDFDRDPAAVLAAGARNWFESSLSIQALCQARGIEYLHVLQPTLHDVGAKPLSAGERELGPVPGGWFEGASQGYPLLRAYVPELEERGVRFLDASRIFEDVAATIYIDHCHLNQRGNAALSESILAAFLAHLPGAPRVQDE